MGRCIRYAGCKPIRSYRSRNNGINAQIEIPTHWYILITTLGFSRRTLKERSELSLKKKLANLRKNNKNKPKEKKKGPVVRSKDKKKSVWDLGISSSARTFVFKTNGAGWIPAIFVTGIWPSS